MSIADDNKKKLAKAVVHNQGSKAPSCAASRFQGVLQNKPDSRAGARVTEAQGRKPKPEPRCLGPKLKPEPCCIGMKPT